MRKNFLKMDKPLLIVTIIFFIFGLIMILSASSMESYMRYEKSPYYYFVRQAIFLASSSFLALIIINIPTQKYKHLSKIIMFVVIAMLVYVVIYGHDANNAKSWIQLGPVSLQPSEFAKVALILYLAMYYDYHKDNLNSKWNIIKPLLVSFLLMALIIIQPDLGTTVILILLTIFIFYAVPMPKVHRCFFTKILASAILLVIVIFIVTKGSFLKDYQKDRFNFFDPCERYQDESGYQLCNSFIAFKNGGLTGKGIGESTQKYLYLPESYTDFIFPIIVEEWGAIVGVIIILMYAFILYRILKISRRAKTLHGALISYGVFAYIFFHIFINLIGVMGLAPLTGVPLPFLSYGGSYAISLMVALALVQRVEIENNRELVRKERRRRRA